MWFPPARNGSSSPVLCSCLIEISSGVGVKSLLISYKGSGRMGRFGRANSAVTLRSKRRCALPSILSKLDAKEVAQFCLIKVWKLQGGTS